jgi:octopine/nopaline transport system permease protein
MDMELLQQAIPFLLKGAQVTLLIGFFGVVVGLPLGVLLALLRLSGRRGVVACCSAFSAFFRGTPLLVQLFILYYGFGQLEFVRHNPVLWWVVGSSLNCAILTVVLNTVAYTSEIFRGAFQSIPHGLVEAAQACGMSKWITLLRVRFPLALRQALPAYGNEIAIVVKESSLASTITVLEITGYAKRLMSETFAIIEIFVIASLFYLVINLLAMLLVRQFEKYLSGGVKATRKIRI